MSEPSPAVFLSYASQDAAAAKRICEALRASDIEVWFDQSELRGGDAWDQKIRQQIRDCALFIPIISANTAARPEGYFRLEWDLADQRTHKIARNRPFVFPVCVDTTPDAGADVPESFVRVQWTRLPGGETPPSFVNRISELLLPNQPEARSTKPRPPGNLSATGMPSGESNAASARWKIPALVIAVLLVLAAGYVALKNHEDSRPAPPAPPPVATTTARTPGAIPDQSIAVLPFVNMSADKEQEYFSDGLSEELIGQLSRIPELRVPARTSSFYFKGKSEDIATIARKLRVAHILEGSVRKAGDRLRVTAELIRADNGYHLWSETYDRQLKDVFKVQDEIASAVVAALKLRLAVVQPVGSQRTQNTEAHNFYLLGRQFAKSTKYEDVRRAVDAYFKAIALDPSYAAAYANLALSQVILADSTVDKSLFKRAEIAADKAVALAPEQADGYAARGFLRFTLKHDWAGAEADLAKALALSPGDSAIQRRHSQLLSSLGRLPEAIAAARKAAELDPLSPNAWQNLGQFLQGHGELVAAREATGRALEIDPTSTYALNDFGVLQLLEGKPNDALSTFRKIDEELFRESGIAMAQHSLGNVQESQRAFERITSKYATLGAYQIAEAHAWRGEKVQALDWLERAYDQGDGGLTNIKYDPLLNSLIGEPRFKALLRRLNLPE